MMNTKKLFFVSLAQRAVRPYIMLIGVLLLVVLGGCISTSSEPEIVTTSVLPTPVPVIAPASFDLTEGATLFTDDCAPCHGSGGMGDGPVASSFSCPVPALALRSPEVVLEEWYKIAYNGKNSGDNCLMPPWNRRLNSAQIWNVAAYAYSLKYGGTDPSGGETLLASLQNAPTDVNFDDSEWQVKNSDTQIISTLTNNFATIFTPDEQLTLLAYVRAQVFTQPVNVAANVPQFLATDQPAPLATEESVAPIATEESAVPPTTEEAAPVTTFTIDGTLINGSAGGALPQDLTLTLRVVTINAAGDTEEVLHVDATPDASGKFTFTDVPRQSRSLAMIQTDYAGIRQFSEQIFPDSITEDVLPLSFSVYDTTTDDSAIRIEYVELLVDAVTSENASLTYQTYQFTNTGDQAYIGENGRTVKMLLPVGAVSPQVQGATGGEDRFEIVQQGEQYVIYDSQPVIPGEFLQMTLGYGFPYHGQMSIQQKFAYPVDDLNVFVSITRGLQLEASQLTQSDPVQLSDITYQGFVLTADTLETSEELRYTVKDSSLPETVSSSSDSDDGSFLQNNTTLILGLGLLMVLAGGMFLFYDLQKTRLQAQAKGAVSGGRKALIAEIAELDDAYDAGKIADDVYERRRTKLKDQLLEMDE